MKIEFIHSRGGLKGEEVKYMDLLSIFVVTLAIILGIVVIWIVWKKN